jgi:hypothetical protein
MIMCVPLKVETIAWKIVADCGAENQNVLPGVYRSGFTFDFSQTPLTINRWIPEK